MSILNDLRDIAAKEIRAAHNDGARLAFEASIRMARTMAKEVPPEQALALAIYADALEMTIAERVRTITEINEGAKDE